MLFYTIFFFSLVIFLTSGGLYYRYLAKGLPSLRALETFEPYQTTRIISNDGVVIKELTKEKRNLIPYHRIPEDMINALVSTEDHRFFKHWGIDTRRFFSVILINIQALRYKQGFSTITMQLSGQLFLDRRERTIARKFREMMLAIQIEKKYSKQEILEMHLNNEHFGHGAYGIHEAARKFFDKDVEDLRIDECALLAGVLNGPGRYSPAFYPDRALNRRNLVLSNMLKHGFISQSQYIDAKGKPLDVKIVLNENLVTTDDIAPYYTEYIRQELENMQSQYGFDLYRDGLTVYTSLNTTAQSIADKVVKEQLEVQQRVANSRYRNRSSRIQLLESFRSIPLDTISTLVENEVYMDSLLNKNNTVQTGFVSMDLNNGYVIAYIGGRDFNSYKWNIPIQSARQPGSVFKPFVYTAAIDNGYPVTHQLLNQDVVIRQPDGTRWAPDNYDKSRGGWTTLREGFRRSLNLISVRLVQEIVPPTEVVKIARKMGITTHIDAVDAIALGSSGVKLIEVVSAYSAFPNNGIKVDPVFITRIEDKYGNVIYEHPQSIRHEVLSAETAHIMTTMMQSVVQSGTGQGSHLYYGFKRPAGGKTGTTNEHTDAWFVGYTPQIVTGVWFGMDNPAVPLGPRQSGAVAALPAWSRYMAAVHDSLALPVMEFTRPPGVVELKICNETKMLAGKYCPDVVTELFNDKYKPAKTCDKHILPSDRYKRKRDR